MGEHAGKTFYRATRLKPGDELPRRKLPTAKVYATPIETVVLPPPRSEGGAPVWRVLRRVRPDPPVSGMTLTLADLSQVLSPLAARKEGRGYPSAGGAYPLEVYVAAQRLQDTFAGTYHYAVKNHQLEQTALGFDAAAWREALLGMELVEAASVLVVFTAVPERSEAVYGLRGYRYALIEAGYAVGAVMVAATALGLAAYPAETFYDEQVSRLLSLPEGEHPVVVLLLGR